MNQILATSNETSKKKNKGPVKITSVARFFAISLIIFGIFLIGTGSYAIYQENEAKNNIPTKPTISEEKKDEKTVLLKVTHDKAIDKIEYSWNDDDVETITGNGRKYIEQEITIPGGENTLHVTAIDVNGQENSYDQIYETEDIIKIEINGSKAKVTAENETEISFMTYRWDDGETQKIDINSTTVDQEIDVPKGEHTLSISLVDVNNETITKEQKIKGVTQPTISVNKDETGENLLVDIVDETGLDKVEFIVNGETKTQEAEEGQTDMKLQMAIPEGEINLKIIAYNIDGIASETFEETITR